MTRRATALRRWAVLCGMAAVGLGVESVAAEPPAREVAFVVTAPVFTGWLKDATVGQVVARQRLDEVLLDEVLGRDKTGDVALASVNAAALVQHVPTGDLAVLVWRTLLRRHGKPMLEVAELTGAESMLLAYALALDHRGLIAAEPSKCADHAQPQVLFAHGRSLVPGDALLGPLMAMAHQVDLARAEHPCAAAKRVDALRFVIQKGALPEAPRRALLQALATVEAQCPSPTP